jgi:hypothetical protein
VILRVWLFSDDGFGISVAENPYFTYLFIKNGSGFIYLEWGQKQAVLGGCIGHRPQTSFWFKINGRIVTSVVDNPRVYYLNTTKHY